MCTFENRACSLYSIYSSSLPALIVPNDFKLILNDQGGPLNQTHLESMQKHAVLAPILEKTHL